MQLDAFIFLEYSWGANAIRGQLIYEINTQYNVIQFKKTYVIAKVI